MTNLEKLINYSVEELADFLAELDEFNVISDSRYCLEVCPKRLNNKCSSDIDRCISEMNKKECIIAWLNHEVEGE